MAYQLRADTHRVWKYYDREVRKLFPATAISAKFDEEKIARGVLALLSDAANIVVTTAPLQFSSQSTLPGYMTSKFSADKARAISETTHFRAVNGLLEDLLFVCVAQLKQPIADLLGTPWRIHNVRVWTTPPNAERAGMYEFHRDGFPWAIFKIMIYFTPMDEAYGALDITHDGITVNPLSGPAGSWVLFYNSTLVHSGRPGTTHERVCAEITLSRAKEFDLALHQPGLNAHWPFEP